MNLRKWSAVLPLWSDCPPRPSATRGPAHHLASNKQEQAHRARRSRCAALQLACRTPPALPMTSETLVDEAEGRKTINKFGVRVFIIKNTCNVHTILLSLGHKAACVWVSSVSYMVRVRRSASAVFTPCPSSIEVRTQPCYWQGGREQKLTEH